VEKLLEKNNLKKEKFPSWS